MTNSSQVSVSVIVIVISNLLTRYLGLTIDNQVVTDFVEFCITVGAAVWALIAHRKVVNAAAAQGVRGL